ncbi:MAG: ZIP family metal transporter [Candidatus Aenigmarchaeota archaeon]|nr:ZIP family metal transporter [Candidatus Aenigmarchaeota archaeon]
MDILLWIIASTFFVSILSFVGVLALSIKEKLLEKILFSLVGLSAGALMGGAFLHLLPESMGRGIAAYDICSYVLVGFVFFFLIEKILHWRHCHKEHCQVHTFAYMNLFGDAVHNFVDGLIIAASFVIDIPLGIVTTIAIILHEIPQEIGDFGVLVYGGFTRLKALFYNFLSALTAIIGGIFGYYLSGYVGISLTVLLPFAAGGFIYISASDLIPEIRKETNTKKALCNFAVFVLGILLMHVLKFFAHGH